MSKIELADHNPFVREDMARLKNALGQIMPEELGKSEQTRILNLACGECWEAETLIDLMANKKNSDHVELVGVDIRGRELLRASERMSKSAKGDSKSHFILDSATKLGDHSELQNNFDLVFLRHQNMYNGRQVWEKIFDQGLSRLSDDGLLVITSYFDHEHRLAIDALQRLGAELLRNERQFESRELAYEGKSVDRHIAVFRLPT